MNKKELVEFIFELIEKREKKISKDILIIGRDELNSIKIMIEKELLKWKYLIYMLGLEEIENYGKM